VPDESENLEGEGTEDSGGAGGKFGIKEALAQARAQLEKGDDDESRHQRGSDFDELSAQGEQHQGSGSGDGSGDEDERPGDEDESAEGEGLGLDEELLEDDDEGSDEHEDDDEDKSGAEAGDESDESEGDGEEEEKEEEEITVSIPGRGPDDDDLEIVVDDQETAERLNQLKNGFMRGEAYRTGLSEIQAAQEELYEIEEQFGVDPAGFVLEHIEEKHLPQVALALMTAPGAWDALKETVQELLEEPSALRTLQAEAKAARFETREALQKARANRTAQNKNAATLREGIERMIPDEMEEGRRTRLLADVTRDVVDHINRHKLLTLEAKDLPTIVAERLELNGIDPLDARKALKDNGQRLRGKPSTRKKSKAKPKTGKQLVKASKKRKKVAAAPGPGKHAAPTEASKLPPGQNLKQRVEEVRKRGLAALLNR